MKHRTESMRIVTRVAQRSYPLVFLLALATTACGEEAIDPIECAAPVDGQCAEGCAVVNVNREYLAADHCTEEDFPIGCVDERLRDRWDERRVMYMVEGRPDERFHHPGEFFEWFDLQGRDLGYCIGDDADGLIEARPEDFCTELNADFERRCEELGRI